MTKEDNGSFLFRKLFDIVDESRKKVCVEEEKALEECLHYLKGLKPKVLVRVDTNTIILF